ncbi:MAG: O-antigen ligase family protein [Patescibacteria group bacterium]
MEILFNLFLLSLILIKLPPFYFTPFQTPFLVTHTLAKTLIFLIFLFVNIFNTSKLRTIFSNKIIILALLTFYFISQSISVIKAQDILFFLKSYQNVITNVTIFWLSFYFIKSLPGRILKLNKTIISLAVFLILFEFTFYVFNWSFIDLLKNIIQKEVIAAYINDLERGRSSIGLNLEIFFPFLIKSSYMLVALSFLSVISNFRTRLVSLFFSAFMSLILFWGKNKKILAFKVILTGLVVIITAAFISNHFFKFNIYDRLLLKDKPEDISTIRFRLESADRSFKLLLSSPIIGIGLGNYLFTDKDISKFNNFGNKENKYGLIYSELVRYSPHNIFFHIMAEVGVLGLVSFSLLIIYFIKYDWIILNQSKKNKFNEFSKACIIGSWTVFAFMLFNPSHTIFVTGWFWALRGFREALT